MPKINDGKLVARVRATKKGKKMNVASEKDLGGKGLDGRKFYEIRNQGEGRWTCSCMSYRFKKGEVGKKSPCKHIIKVITEWKKQILDANEVVILEPNLL